MTVSDPGYGASGGRSQEKFSQAGDDLVDVLKTTEL